jgi:restriction system protein
MNYERTLWGIHAGKTGDAETLFEKRNVVAVGANALGDLFELENRDDFKVRFRRAYPDGKTMKVGVSAG